MPPLICTSNTQSHVDYGIPLLASKSTDYRTCTGTYHRFIPNYPQNFDCRVPVIIKKELLVKDVALKDDLKSSYNCDFVPKSRQDVDPNHYSRADGVHNVKAVRNIQERLTKNPPIPIGPKISEMKESYKLNSFNPRIREAIAPALYAICDIKGLGRPLQPMIPPYKEGHWKHLDIYMTENKLNYIPYDQHQMEKCREDITTFYSATGQYKGLKNKLPGPLQGNRQLPRFLSRGQKRCPNFGMQSEYQGKYIPQTYSDFYPYIHENGVLFDDSLAGPSPWQNLSPPGMYCTEYCHIGNMWPVRSAVDIGKVEEKRIVHLPCNKKVDG
ncbi:hypothetical protein JTB14_009510 [Gonioctena quinquepunctata]|nr:hypothetical protein JTB14_009510 [Gonioctena quinquepunctata]